MAPLAELLARYAGPPASMLDKKHQGEGCVPFDPAARTAYNYVPSVVPGAVFVACFALAMIGHIAQTAISRRWWYLSFVLGALCELMGWAARLSSHWCPYNTNAFTLQISILIIAPCFYSAALYYVEADLIRKFGTKHSFISPKLYLWIFIGADLLSIIVQGTGGGLASAESTAIPPKDPKTGTHIMIVGIVIQLVSMTLFSFLLFWTMWSTREYWLTGSHLLQDAHKVKMGLAAAIFATCMILARNYYRAVELAQGWSGYLISHEVFFCVLDGGLMVLAVAVFNLFHPAWCINPEIRPAIKDVDADHPSSDEVNEIASKKARDGSRFQMEA